MSDRAVIVGASLGGLRCAEALRRGGFAGDLVIIGDEPHQPYDRPPLSKQVLAGTWPEGQAMLRQADDLKADWRLGVAAVGFDAATRTIVLADGSEIDGDRVVLATGATPRHLAGADGIAGVHVLRGLDDARALRAALTTTPAPAVVVIGAGFIGAEVASTAASLGCDVVVVEALPVPLERQLGPTVAPFVAGLHELGGVRLLAGVGVAGLTSHGRHVTGVDLVDGNDLAASVVVVGIGVAPNVGWLEGSGLDTTDGVLCDAALRAIDPASGDAFPGIVAIGDICRWPNQLYPGAPPARIEHWSNAVDQAMHAATTLLGDAKPFAPVPYFWSDQHGHKLQVVGRADPSDDVVWVEGGPQLRPGQPFVAVYGREGRIVAAAAMDRPGRIMGWRGRIERREVFPPPPA